MQTRRGFRPAGEDEALQRLQPLVDEIAQLLEALHLFGRDAQPLAFVLERDGEVGTEVEEVVLDLLEPGAELRRELAREDQPEQRVELVDCSVGLDPGIGLGHAAAVTEARLPCVPGAGIDPRQPNRLVAAAPHAGEYRAVACRAARLQDLHRLDLTKKSIGASAAPA